MSCQFFWLSLVLNMAGTKCLTFQLTTTTGRGRRDSSGVFISCSGFCVAREFWNPCFLGPASLARVCIDSDKMRYCSLA